MAQAQRLSTRIYLKATAQSKSLSLGTAEVQGSFV